MALAVAKTLDVYLISRVEDAASEYNIRRIADLVTAIVIAIIVVFDAVRKLVYHGCLVRPGFADPGS
jgi:hypothetical protein